VRVTVGRRESLLLSDETLIDLTEGSIPSLVDPGLRAETDVAIDGGPSVDSAPEDGPDAEPGPEPEVSS
jgi:hypothetical protein